MVIREESTEKKQYGALMDKEKDEMWWKQSKNWRRQVLETTSPASSLYIGEYLKDEKEHLNILNIHVLVYYLYTNAV